MLGFFVGTYGRHQSLSFSDDAHLLVILLFFFVDSGKFQAKSARGFQQNTPPFTTGEIMPVSVCYPLQVCCKCCFYTEIKQKKKTCPTFLVLV